MVVKIRFAIPHLLAISFGIFALTISTGTAVAQSAQPSTTERGVWFRCLREKWPEIQLGANGDTAYVPETQQNLAWDAEKKSWIDVKTGATVKGACNTPRGAWWRYCLRLQFPEIQLGANGDTAYDPESQRNFAWEKDKQAWIDVKSGECVCPKCPPTEQPPTGTPPSFKPNEINFNFSFIREDSDPRFNTYGFNGSYTYYFNPTVGITGDVNAHFKNESGADLSKYSVLGGVTVVPFEGAKTTDKVTISMHALFGVSHFKADNGVSRFTDNAFTIKLGGAVDVNVNEHIFIRLPQIDYAPTRFGGHTQHNVQVGAGVGFRFGGK